MTVRLLDRLQVHRGEDACSDLPQWAKFMLAIGGRMGVYSAAERRVVVGLALPTRCAAAVLACAGGVVARAEARTKDFDSELDSHFARLREGAKGTPVLVQMGGKLEADELDGVWSYRGQAMVRMTRHDGGRLSIPIYESWRVQLVEAEGSRGQELIGSHTLDRGGFIREALGYATARVLLSGSTLDCVVVGRVGLLSDEFRSLELSVRGSSAQTLGSLADLARPRQLVDGRMPRSALISVARPTTPAQGSQAEVPLVVFDGAPPFLKWRQQFSTSNWLVLLSKTEPQVEDAAAVLNANYAGRGLDDDAVLTQLIDGKPRSVDAIAYVEAR